MQLENDLSLKLRKSNVSSCGLTRKASSMTDAKIDKGTECTHLSNFGASLIH